MLICCSVSLPAGYICYSFGQTDVVTCTLHVSFSEEFFNKDVQSGKTGRTCKYINICMTLASETAAWKTNKQRPYNYLHFIPLVCAGQNHQGGTGPYYKTCRSFYHGVIYCIFLHRFPNHPQAEGLSESIPAARTKMCISKTTNSQ